MNNEQYYRCTYSVYLARVAQLTTVTVLINDIDSDVACWHFDFSSFTNRTKTSRTEQKAARQDGIVYIGVARVYDWGSSCDVSNAKANTT